MCACIPNLIDASVVVSEAIYGAYASFRVAEEVECKVDGAVVAACANFENDVCGRQPCMLGTTFNDAHEDCLELLIQKYSLS